MVIMFRPSEIIVWVTSHHSGTKRTHGIKQQPYQETRGLPPGLPKISCNKCNQDCEWWVCKSLIQLFLCFWFYGNFCLLLKRIWAKWVPKTKWLHVLQARKWNLKFIFYNEKYNIITFVENMRNPYIIIESYASHPSTKHLCHAACSCSLQLMLILNRCKAPYMIHTLKFPPTKLASIADVGKKHLKYKVFIYNKHLHNNAFLKPTSSYTPPWTPPSSCGQTLSTSILSLTRNKKADQISKNYDLLCSMNSVILIFSRIHCNANSDLYLTLKPHIYTLYNMPTTLPHNHQDQGMYDTPHHPPKNITNNTRRQKQTYLVWEKMKME